MQRVEESKQALMKKEKGNIRIKSKLQKISFHLQYQTTYGQEIYVYGNHPLLGNGQIENARPLVYLNDDYWVLHLSWNTSPNDELITYHYFIKNTDSMYDLLETCQYYRRSSGNNKEFKEAVVKYSDYLKGNTLEKTITYHFPSASVDVKTVNIDGKLYDVMKNTQKSFSGLYLNATSICIIEKKDNNKEFGNIYIFENNTVILFIAKITKSENSNVISNIK